MAVQLRLGCECSASVLFSSMLVRGICQPLVQPEVCRGYLSGVLKLVVTSPMPVLEQGHPNVHDAITLPHLCPPTQRLCHSVPVRQCIPASGCAEHCACTVQFYRFSDSGTTVTDSADVTSAVITDTVAAALGGITGALSAAANDGCNIGAINDAQVQLHVYARAQPQRPRSIHAGTATLCMPVASLCL